MAQKSSWLIVLSLALLSANPGDTRAHPTVGENHPDHHYCPLREQPTHCPAGASWNDVSFIPVRISPTLAQHMLHRDLQTPWSLTELAHEVQFVLERFNDQSSANIPPLRFAGFEAPGLFAGDDAPDRTIVLRTFGFANSADGQPVCTRGRMIGCEDNGVRILFASSLHCNKTFEHFDFFPPGNNETFAGILMHELVHAVGLDHADQCHGGGLLPAPACNSPPGYCCGSVNCGDASSANQLMFDDVQGLRAIYGPAHGSSELVHRLQSSDGVSWADPFLPGTPIPFLGSYVTGGDAQIFMPLAATDEQMDPHTHVWVQSDLFVDLGKTEALSPQLGPMGSALGDGFFTTFYMSGQSTSNTLMFPRQRRQDAPEFGDGITGTNADSFRTQRNGHRGAHDPRSGQFLHAWRFDDGQIRLSVSATDGSAFEEPVQDVADAATGAPELAAYPPDIACGPASIPFNCLMVWVVMPAGVGAPGGQTEGHFYTLRFAQFRMEQRLIFPVGARWRYMWSPTTWEMSTLQYGPPAISYKGPPGDPGAFVLSWKGSAECYYTNRKSTDHQTSFGQFLPGDEREHCLPCASVDDCVQLSPPAGFADVNSATSQAWVIGNDY